MFVIFDTSRIATFDVGKSPPYVLLYFVIVLSRIVFFMSCVLVGIIKVGPAV